MRVVTFKVDEQLLSKLDSLARLKGVPRSEIIRQALELYLKLADYREQPPYKHVKLMS